MIVCTSRYNYSGADRLDITRKGNLEPAFMPTWGMIDDHKKGRITDEEYVRRYYALMRRSYRKHRDRWLEVMAMEKVTLVCFCKSGCFCHRYVLKDIFCKMGAQYGGEVDAQSAN